MDRDLIVAVLLGMLCGPLLLLGGAIPLKPRRACDVRALERGAWRSLWVPTIPAWLALGFVVGWAMQEPDASDESVPLPGALVAIAFAVLWARALLRALRSALARRTTSTAATFGLLAPTIHVADALRAVLDEGALHATLAHEEAHRRARDPLRILLAQLLADLQWPSPGARARFSRWRNALELLRDDDARCAGADGADLAAAVLLASKLTSGPHACAIEGHAHTALVERVQRLMEPTPVRRPPDVGLLAPIACIAFAAALVIGYELGDGVVRTLTGVGA